MITSHKRALLHLLHQFRLKTGIHKQSITMEDLDQLSKAIMSGYGNVTRSYTSPLQIEELKIVFDSIKFP